MHMLPRRYLRVIAIIIGASIGVMIGGGHGPFKRSPPPRPPLSLNQMFGPLVLGSQH